MEVLFPSRFVRLGEHCISTPWQPKTLHRYETALLTSLPPLLLLKIAVQFDCVSVIRYRFCGFCKGSSRSIASFRSASNEEDSKSIWSPFHQEVNALQYSENETLMKPPPNVTGARSLLSKAFMGMINISFTCSPDGKCQFAKGFSGEASKLSGVTFPSD